MGFWALTLLTPFILHLSECQTPQCTPTEMGEAMVVNPGSGGYSISITKLRDDNVANLSSIVFWTKADSSVCIGLSNTGGLNSANARVAIGGYGNTMSVLDACTGLTCSTKYAQMSHAPLNATQFKPFWIYWYNGNVHVGSGTIVGSNVFLTGTVAVTRVNAILLGGFASYPPFEIIFEECVYAPETTKAAAETTTPAVQTTTPAAQTTTPAVQTTTPAVQTTTPAVQTTTPVAQTTTPAVQTTTPAVQTTTPAVQTTTPAVQTTTPAVQTTTPAVQTTTPAVQTTTPAVQTTTPAAATTTPVVQTTTPAVQTTTPAAQTTTPAVQTTTPAAETTTPASNAASGNNVFGGSFGNATVAAGNQSTTWDTSTVAIAATPVPVSTQLPTKSGQQTVQTTVGSSVPTTTTTEESLLTTTEESLLTTTEGTSPTTEGTAASHATYMTSASNSTYPMTTTAKVSQSAVSTGLPTSAQLTSTLKAAETESTTKRSTTVKPVLIRMCRCRCVQQQPELTSRQEQLRALEEEMNELRKDMTVAPRNTSAAIRKKISAPDDRKSSAVLGSLSAAFVFIPLAAIMLADILALLHTILTCSTPGTVQ